MGFARDVVFGVMRFACDMMRLARDMMRLAFDMRLCDMRLAFDMRLCDMRFACDMSFGGVVYGFGRDTFGDGPSRFGGMRHRRAFNSGGD